MPKLRTSDLVNSIAQLGTQRVYEYPSGNGQLRITEIAKPEGPITFLRWGIGKSEAQATKGSISTNQLATVVSVFSSKPNYPIHFDRLFSAGGNTRSAFEALLAHTPHFFICYLQRTQLYTGTTGTLKHIMWCPNDEHPLGQIGETTYDQVISEVELDVDFGDIRVTPGMLDEEFDSIETKKIHTQMQVALVEIGNALNFRTWIARNDQSIPVRDTQLGKLKSVIQSLDEVRILYNSESKKAASLIDCIWFKNDKHIPAVIEVEHSTGVTSGLTRMLKLKEAIPSIATKFTVVAPDGLRNKVVTEANNPVFRSLKARFMPYSVVRELYGLIQRYNLSNVVEQSFIEPFMENVVE